MIPPIISQVKGYTHFMVKLAYRTSFAENSPAIYGLSLPTSFLGFQHNLTVLNVQLVLVLLGEMVILAR